MTYSSSIAYRYDCELINLNETAVTFTTSKCQQSNSFKPFAEFFIKVNFITHSRIQAGSLDNGKPENP